MGSIEKNYKLMTYLDKKGLAKQSLILNMPALTDYMLPMTGLPYKVILEISEKMICFKANYRDFEHGDVEEIIGELSFNELDDFSIRKTKNEGVYHIEVSSKAKKIGLNCSNGLNDEIAKEIVDYVKEIV